MGISESALDRFRQITHDLNGEIFVIRGHTELAIAKSSNGEDIERHLESILKRCDDMIQSLQSLRDLRQEVFPAPDPDFSKIIR